MIASSSLLPADPPAGLYPRALFRSGNADRDRVAAIQEGEPQPAPSASMPPARRLTVDVDATHIPASVDAPLGRQGHERLAHRQPELGAAVQAGITGKAM